MGFPGKGFVNNNGGLLFAGLPTDIGADGIGGEILRRAMQPAGQHRTAAQLPGILCHGHKHTLRYVLGQLRVAQAFAPVLAANGGGAIVNMLSVTSFYTNPFNASYGASKAAAWSLTNGVRLELHRQGTLVVAVHAGFIDTDMAALVDAPKISPESVAQQVFDAVEAGRIEVLADERTRFIKASLSHDHELIYPPVQEFWDAAVGGTS